MKRPCFTIALVLITASTSLIEFSSAGEHFFSHRQRTRTRSHLPGHSYGHDVWPFTTPQSFQVTEISVAATNPTDSGQQIKPFHFRANALSVHHITLDEVGIALHKSGGRLFATGRITHTGGDGGLIGNNVTIRLRAYVAPAAAIAPDVTAPAVVVSPPALTPPANLLPPPVVDGETPPLNLVPPVVVNEIPLATPNEVTRIPPDAYKVWESEHKLWVSRGRPHHIQLAPNAARLTDRETLTHHFGEITHIEVELEYRKDR